MVVHKAMWIIWVFSTTSPSGFDPVFGSPTFDSFISCTNYRANVALEENKGYICLPEFYK